MKKQTEKQKQAKMLIKMKEVYNGNRDRSSEQYIQKIIKWDWTFEWEIHPIVPPSWEWIRKLDAKTVYW